MATGFSDGTIKILDAVNGNEKATFKPHASNVMRVVFRPRVAQIASQAANAKEIVLSDLIGRQIWRIAAHSTSVQGLCFDPSGNTLATCGVDKGRDFLTVKLWDSQSGELKQTITGFSSTGGIRGVAFSPNGKLLTFAIDRTENKKTIGDLVFWDIEKNKESKRIS